MRVEYHSDAADQFDSYELTDRLLCEAFDEVIELLENDPNNSRLRRHQIRPVLAYAVQVFPKGRGGDPRSWWLFWIPEDDDVAFVKYAGPGDFHF
jgi:hypothetical protein